MALPLIAAGVAARYGAKKLAKHLTKQTLKKQRGKTAVKKNKNNKTTSNLSNTGEYGRIYDKKQTRNFIRQDYKKIKKAADYIEKNPSKNPGAAEEFVLQTRTNIDNVISNFAKGSSRTQMKKAQKKVLKNKNLK